jgi:hypothetical protein
MKPKVIEYRYLKTVFKRNNPIKRQKNLNLWIILLIQTINNIKLIQWFYQYLCEMYRSSYLGALL